MTGDIRESLLTCSNCKCIHAEYSLSFAFYQLRENKILIKPPKRTLRPKKNRKKNKRQEMTPKHRTETGSNELTGSGPKLHGMGWMIGILASFDE